MIGAVITDITVLELSTAFTYIITRPILVLSALNENGNCEQFDVDFGGVQKLI
jgi:hypothetical protein